MAKREINGKYFTGERPLFAQSKLKVCDTTFGEGDYLAMNSSNMVIEDLNLVGNYCFDGAKNLTLINCTVESLQGMCYLDNLVMKNSRLNNTTLAFEYSTVDVDIQGSVDSVKNPSGGRIRADEIGDLIMEADKVDRGLNTDEVAEPNVFAQIAPIAAFGKGGSWLDELNAYLWENRVYAEEFISREIPSFFTVKGEATYLLWIDCTQMSGLPQRLGRYVREASGLYLSDGRALQIGDVNKVTPIDKSSTVLTMVLAWIFLGEGISVIKFISMILIGVGTYMMIQKKVVDGGNSPETSDSNKWLIYAFGSAIFASLTSILGKVGIQDINSNLGTAIRTVVVLVMAWVMVFITGKQNAVKDIDKKSWLFLILSGIATGASWLCYYRALQDGPASVVMPIDKLSILVTIAFSYIVFREKLSVFILSELCRKAPEYS